MHQTLNGKLNELKSFIPTHSLFNLGANYNVIGSPKFYRRVVMRVFPTEPRCAADCAASAGVGVGAALIFIFIFVDEIMVSVSLFFLSLENHDDDEAAGSELF